MGKEGVASLNNIELNKSYKKYKQLIEVASPVIEDLYELIKIEENLIILFLDSQRRLLKVWGKSDFQNFEEINIEYSNEKIYCEIKNLRNEVIGYVSIWAKKGGINNHTYPMLVSTVKSIENEMKLDKINKNLFKANKRLYDIMESINEGIIGVDSKGNIKNINQFARKLLSFEEKNILGKNIENIISLKNKDLLEAVIKEDKRFEEHEMYFMDKNKKRIYCIANMIPLKDLDLKKVEGALLIFRKAKEIHTLVNKIVGAHAIFTFEDIIGESQALKDIKEIAHKVSNGNTTILLQGESGTGKELFAQAIHNASNRASKPFIFINCGAIPRELVASELFGYVEGAFTGAKKGGHPGKFELADEGTIFLDEIGDMPLDTQANLLRVLETKSIVRVGGHNVIPTDVRVIAATHKDLKEEVKLGNFREDLFYRLNVMPIRTPSLRERKDDIKIFVEYFNRKFSEKMNKKVVPINQSFYRHMLNYDWPGNVRELQNVMQLVVNMVEEDEEISYRHLPQYMKKNVLVPNKQKNNNMKSLEEIEKEAIINTLLNVKNNLAQAANILKIGRTTLYRKIEKYNLGYIFDK